MNSKRLTRGQAIKKYCKESCCAGSLVDWKECPTTHCFLWRYHSGKETLAKPLSFKKQRKSRVFSAKNTIVDPDINSQQTLQATLEVEGGENGNWNSKQTGISKESGI